jgi:hypothetical protein
MGVLSHDHRESVIKWYVDVLRMLNMEDKTIGFYLRSLHVHTPIYLLIAMQTCTFPFAVIVLACLFIALVYFFLYDGCVLSKIEKTLDGQDITIVDPFLEIRGVKKTKKNRMRISYVFAGGYILLMLLIFLVRFYL